MTFPVIGRSAAAVPPKKSRQEKDTVDKASKVRPLEAAADAMTDAEQVIESLVNESETAALLQSSSTDDAKTKLLSGDSSETSENAGNMVSVEGPPRSKRARGLVYVVVAGFCFSVMSTSVKYACQYMSPHEVGLWRTVIALVFNYVIVLIKKIDLRVDPALRNALFCRCFTGTLGFVLSGYAVSQMVLTDAIVIMFTSPVFTFILGAWVLNEPIDRVDISLACLSYSGVFFVARPAFLFGDDESSHATAAPSTGAIVSAFSAAIVQALMYISTRKLKNTNSILILHYLSLFGGIFLLAVVLVLKVHMEFSTEPKVVLVLVLSALCSCFGVIFLTLGFQLESAGIASVMRNFDVVFIFAMDVLLLGEHVSGYSVIGAFLIVGGAALIGVRRVRSKA